MFLHAHRIQLPMPEGMAPVDAEAPVPTDLTLVLDKLRRFSSPRDARMEYDA